MHNKRTPEISTFKMLTANDPEATYVSVHPREVNDLLSVIPLTLKLILRNISSTNGEAIFKFACSTDEYFALLS